MIEYTDVNNIFGVIFLEVDEDQHKGCPISCDVSRMSNIVESLLTNVNTIPIHFIRYNPHSYKINNKQF